MAVLPPSNHRYHFRRKGHHFVPDLKSGVVKTHSNDTFLTKLFKHELLEFMFLEIMFQG
jgi:hypothetical protein